jgi:hypothetical protein
MKRLRNKFPVPCVFTRKGILEYALLWKCQCPVVPSYSS